MTRSAACTVKTVLTQHDSKYISREELTKYLAEAFGTDKVWDEQMIEDRWEFWAPKAVSWTEIKQDLPSHPVFALESTDSAKAVPRLGLTYLGGPLAMLGRQRDRAQGCARPYTMFGYRGWVVRKSEVEA